MNTQNHLSLLDEFFGWPFARREVAVPQAVHLPPVDVVETETAYALSFDLPGISKEAIQIEVKDDRLKVSAERKRAATGAEKGQDYTEFVYGRFERSFELPPGVNPEGVQAQYENGVLKVSVPKPENKKTKNYTIQVA